MNWAIGKDHVRLDLFQCMDGASQEDLREVAITHLALFVNTQAFKRVQDQLKELQIPFEPQELSDDSHSILLQDPDGHRIEITTYHRTRPRITIPLNRNTLRWVLALFALVLSISALGYSAFRYITTSYRYSARTVEVLDDVPYNELTNGGVQTKLNMSSSIFQVGLLLIAGVGGLLLAREDEARLVFRDKPEFIMAVLAILLLCISFMCHVLYLSEVSYLYGTAIKLQQPNPNPSIPDVFHHSVDYLFQSQWYCFLAGLVVTLLTFFSTHKLRKGMKQ